MCMDRLGHRLKTTQNSISNSQCNVKASRPFSIQHACCEGCPAPPCVAFGASRQPSCGRKLTAVDVELSEAFSAKGKSNQQTSYLGMGLIQKGMCVITISHLDIGATSPRSTSSRHPWVKTHMQTSIHAPHSTPMSYLPQVLFAKTMSQATVYQGSTTTTIVTGVLHLGVSTMHVT